MTKLLCLFVCLSIATNAAAQSRGSWMWKKSGHTYGSISILGDAAKEAQAIASMGTWGFDRLYTSTSLTTTDPATVANWNSSLDAAGISSQYLMGENGAAVEPVRSDFLVKVQDRLIDYNNSRADLTEWFGALHLDIEPHTTTAWDTGTPTDRRDILLGLETTYSAVRSLLDSDGQSAVKLYADIPVWYDSSSNIGWTNDAERDQWFDDVALSLDGLTMMAYERDTLSHIVSGISYEANNFAGEVRVAINAKEIGPGETFADFTEYTAMATALEGSIGIPIGGVDHHPYYSYAELSPIDPLPPILADYNADGSVDIIDYNTWATAFGKVVAPSTGADGNGNGVIDAADYTVWRDRFIAPSVAIPEPGAFVLALTVLGLAAAHQRAR